MKIDLTIDLEYVDQAHASSLINKIIQNVQAEEGVLSARIEEPKPMWSNVELDWLERWNS